MNDGKCPGSIWGIDIGGSTIILGRLCKGDFQVVKVMRMNPGSEPDNVLESICSEIRSADPSPHRAGIGIAGLVMADRGILVHSPNLPLWRNCPVGRITGELLECPVAVDNDCNVFALGAIDSGRIPREGLWLMVTLGTGIGGTIVNDGRIIYGTGFAGEFGHMTVEANGLPCPCGSRGCWERYAAAGALLNYFTGEGGDPGIDPRGVFDLARSGQDAARKAFRRFGQWLGVGIANLYQCFSPEGIFLAGGL